METVKRVNRIFQVKSKKYSFIKSCFCVDNKFSNTNGFENFDCSVLIVAFQASLLLYSGETLRSQMLHERYDVEIYVFLFSSYSICVRPEAGYDCVQWQV